MPDAAALPPDDLSRSLTVISPDDPGLPHLSIVSDTYTTLLTGEQTGGKYCLIDMYIPPGGGPAPHRHDFEEMFTLLDGEIEAMFRGEKQTIKAGQTVNIPANAPHAFKNVSDQPARLLCMCITGVQAEFFAAVGQPVATRTSPAPAMDDAAKKKWIETMVALAPKYRTEPLPMK